MAGRAITNQMDKFSNPEEVERRKILKVLNSNLEELNSNIKELNSNLEGYPLFLEDSEWAVPMDKKIQTCQLGIRLLRMLVWSFSTLDAEIRHTLIPVNRYLECMWERSRHEIESRVLNLQGIIHKCNQKFEQLVFSSSTVESSSRRNPLTNSSTMELLDEILWHLKDLYKFKTGDEILLLNNQIASLESKVTLLRNLFNLTPIQSGDLRAFNVVVHLFAQYSARLVFLYRVKLIDEEMATQLDIFLFNVLRKYKPCVTAFKAVYITFLKEMKSIHFNSLLLGRIVQSFLDLLLENLILDISKEDFQIIQQSLFFVISFLADPPHQHVEDQELMMMITAETEILVKEVLYRVLSVDDMNGDYSQANTCLGDFKRKAEQVKSKIQQVYTRTQDTFSYDFPKINGLGFFDFLLQNLSFLKEKLKRDTDYIPFAKHLIIQIEEELMSLRPYLDHLFEQQKEDKELKDTWLKVIDLAYQSEYAINSCSVDGDQLWYNMARLMEVLDKLKDVYSNAKKIEGRKTHDSAILHCSAVAPNRVPEDPLVSGFNEVMVGLEEEAEKIVGNLINGYKYLDVVAIVGMPGQGKTTMANKVYIAPAVRNYFHVFAYCIVSQICSTRRILLDILGDIRGKDENMYEMMEEDLAHMLRKCLLGKKYLIIMDDIWDVEAWDEIKRSLPNSQNGSRVIFTTRNRNVALLAKEDCILHDLRFMSDEESWELLRKKTFQAEDCPPDFLEVGKMIANNCKGLPLTIVLIAGLLRTKRSLCWWNEISEAVSSYVLTEDAMSVLELSYQHLPEHLKQCILYFGAFVEDAYIRVNKLVLLWIAEGFVVNSKWENLENVARDYLSDLVDRSLVIAIARSSYGGIKSCRIHDLVHEFCQRKAQEENFFQLMVNNKASKSSSSTLRMSNSSTSTLRNSYRLCIHGKGTELDARNISPSIRSLLRSSESRIYNLNLNKLKLVQVMDLDYHIDSSNVFESAVHLRFMSIIGPPNWVMPSDFPDIELHDFLSSHWNLEILIFRRGFCGNLPEAFWNMTRLRHVHVKQCSLSKPSVRKHEAYPYPQMVNLESFSTIHVSSTEELEVLLLRSPSLRKLGFRSLADSAFSTIYFPKLDSLSKLESLKVYGVGEACLCSFNLLSSLKKLSLVNCKLEWRYMSVISKMPCLEVLKLLWTAFVGPKWDMEDAQFPKLKFLKLQGLYLSEWIAYVESFPCLEVLILDGCYRLEKIPSCFGEMPTLKSIEVHGSSNAAASVVEIQEAQKDFGNEELRVIISSTLLYNTLMT